jgi:hypothetical protein
MKRSCGLCQPLALSLEVFTGKEDRKKNDEKDQADKKREDAGVLLCG